MLPFKTAADYQWGCSILCTGSTLQELETLVDLLHVLNPFNKLSLATSHCLHVLSQHPPPLNPTDLKIPLRHQTQLAAFLNPSCLQNTPSYLCKSIQGWKIDTMALNAYQMASTTTAKLYNCALHIQPYHCIIATGVRDSDMALNKLCLVCTTKNTYQKHEH